jgi:hypothetical protein
MTFFKLEGAIPWLVTRSFFQPRYRPYRKKITYLPRMLDNSKALHAIALNRMTASDFQQKALEIQHLISDEAIEKALRTWPDTIYQLNAEEVREKIIALREDLPRYAAEFYTFISKKVEIGGTDQMETFTLAPADGGGLRARVFSRTSGEEAILHYDRIFYPNETQELSLLGLGGNDVFDIRDGCLSSHLKINIVGGPGQDTARVENAGQQPLKYLKIMDEDEMEAPPQLIITKNIQEDFHWLEALEEDD